MDSSSYEVTRVYNFATDEEGSTQEISCESNGEISNFIVPILIALISGVGIFFNILVIFFIGILREYKKTATNKYVLQLAIADSIFLLQLPFQVSFMLSGKWTYGISWCKLSESIKMMNYYASIMFLTIMSVDRCLAINFPTDDKVAKLRSKTLLTSSILWMMAILSTIDILKFADVQDCSCQIFFPAEGETDYTRLMDELSGMTTDKYDYDIYKDYGNESSTGIEDYNDIWVDDGRSCSYNSPYIPQKFRTWLICNFVLAFLLPLIIICVSYGLIIRRIVRPTVVGEKGKSNKTRKRVTIMVSALVSAFIICWLPYHTFQLARLNDTVMFAETCKIISNFTIVLAYANSAINPFFYIFLGTKFQKRWKIAVRTLSSGFTMKAFSHSNDYTTGTATQRRRSSALSTKSRSFEKGNLRK